MSAGLKRPLDTSSRSVSPPAIRRRLTQTHVATTSSSATGAPRSADPITIFSWNVNGVGPLLQPQLDFERSSVTPLRRFLRRHGWPHLLCLQEVKISAKDPATQRRLEVAANRGHQPDEDEHTYTCHFSLPRDKFNATGFGGKVHGVATLVRDDFAPRVRATRRPDWDLEGRVLMHELAGDVAVINGYWVNGTSNPYHDPITGAVSGTRHDYKLRFHQHMLREVLRYEQHGTPVVLVGDMNVARSRLDGHPNLRTSPVQHVTNRADFNAKFFDDANGMRGVDVYRHMHGEQRKYTFHPPGRGWGESCDRVDLIIVSRALAADPTALVATDICDNALDRGHSDHVPLWLTLRIPSRPERKSAHDENNSDARKGQAR